MLAAICLLSAGTVLWADDGQEKMVFSYSLAGRVIAIDPGHGGIDPGTVGRNMGTPEKDITLAVARRLADLLSQSGAMVVMTRNGDNDLSDAGKGLTLLERKRQDLQRRVDRCRAAKAEIYISIHVNADESPKWWGAQTFYYTGSETSRNLAECIQQELISVLGKNNRKAKEGTFFVMEKTETPAVIVEIGFLSNPGEERLLNDSRYQSQAAYAIFSGIARYYSLEGGM